MSIRKPPPRYQIINVLASQLAYGTDFYIKLPFEADFIMILQGVMNADGETFQGGCVPSGADLAKYQIGLRLNDPAAPVLVCTPTSGYIQDFAVIEAQIDSIYVRPLTAAGESASAIYGLSFLVGKDMDLGSYGAVFD